MVFFGAIQFDLEIYMELFTVPDEKKGGPDLIF
jgi:hypothetical protein